MLARLRNIITRASPEAAELPCAGGLLLFGVWLLLPLRTFSTATAYRALAIWAAEEQWGAVFALFGAASLVILLTTYQRVPRTLGTVLTGFSWAFLAVLTAMSNLAIPAIPVYALFALGSAWAGLRLQEEAHNGRSH